MSYLLTTLKVDCQTYTLNSKERIKHSIKERNILREHSFFLSVEKFKNTQKAMFSGNTLVREIIPLEMKPKTLLLVEIFRRGKLKRSAISSVLSRVQIDPPHTLIMAGYAEFIIFRYGMQCVFAIL